MTNYSINKKNKNFKNRKNLADDTLPYKWSLTNFFFRLKKWGIDVDLIWEQIYDLIIKSILSCEKYISPYTKDHFQKINKSFEIFGYDVMIDSNLKPWLMEINLSPSLSLESIMDIKLKTKLITELFNMYGFRKLTTATLIEDKKQEDSAPKPDEPDEEDKADEPTPEEVKIKSKIKNFKFIQPELSHKQKEKVTNLIENDESLSQKDKEDMLKLFKSPFKENIIETFSEYTRKEDYIRIFPSRGSNEYFKFFTYNLEVNKQLYEFCYGEDNKES